MLPESEKSAAEEGDSVCILLDLGVDALDEDGLKTEEAPLCCCAVNLRSMYRPKGHAT
jgi:hypothetical protein